MITINTNISWYNICDFPSLPSYNDLKKYKTKNSEKFYD